MGKGGDKGGVNAQNLDGKYKQQHPWRDDFYHASEEEPHAVRRRIILKAHPEIEKLFVPDLRPVPLVIAMVLSQWILAYYCQFWSYPVYFGMAYLYSGTVCHSLSLMAHELSHNLVFKTRQANEWFGIFCNLACGIPSAVTFKRYHMEHHQFQGREGIDVDIPTYLEGRWVHSAPAKLLFLFLMPLMYGFRPAIIRPKNMTIMELVNIVAVLATYLVVYSYAGWAGALYLPVSFLLGHSLHPMAGHFVAEHFVFVEGHETYSYYGPLNLLAWNVGYHNEHHDFPRVPGWRLPQVRALAPEFYESLPCHSSWIAVMLRFVFDERISAFSRVVRSTRSVDKDAATALDIDAASFGPEVSAATDLAPGMAVPGAAGGKGKGKVTQQMMPDAAGITEATRCSNLIRQQRHESAEPAAGSSKDKDA